MTCFMCGKELPKNHPNDEFCSQKCHIKFVKQDFKKESDTFSVERYVNDREQLSTAIRNY